MSSNRLIYDKCAYATEIKESTGSLEYNLFQGKYESCKQCTVGNFTNNLPFGPKTDTESELLGLTRPSTKCPSLKFDASNRHDLYICIFLIFLFSDNILMKCVLGINIYSFLYNLISSYIILLYFIMLSLKLVSFNI